MGKTMTDSADQGYNKFIAQRLGLDEGLDFMNNSQDLHKAEEEISKRGLTEGYLQALNDMDSSKLDENNLDDFKTEKPGFRALAIVKLLKEEKNDN
jgi:hypothetical protein